MSNLKFQSIAATYQESSFTIKVFMFSGGGGGGGEGGGSISNLIKYI